MANVTIKQLAEEIGVSKTAITKKITPEMKTKYFAKNGNRFVINENGQKAIKQLFGKEFKGKPETKNENRTKTEMKTDNQEVFDLLKEELHKKDNYLKEKDKQIAQLQKLLEQQQILTLQANKKVERLEMEKEDQEDSLEKKKEKSRGFFARFFNNKEKN
ncbi:DUF536 domain-containing protein [Listeria monocytogenes]|uniref:DUF536 domain-containing protein n=1 Tax=Listeria monocytogenes TaxID=1639 RepID=UPI0009854B65|nr:DUF536 domain-containing protein [Listeria monocytogenes]EAA0173046.1 DUF536 domain-containing protein [Listeria monocytogenes]EAA0215162.1 DUF536 domain-containing protein [Listeria monocytogenes]EAA0295658.1 DUF536 domain-containing protein [Listeria monocytogenes]EAC4916831.1 DUF536 domain-containing protein [Listeria monocytogenes]EAC4937874.1 DUF536 domain-containing protein [Listeria monocytogenes]